jgi:hypothetical protein
MLASLPTLRKARSTSTNRSKQLSPKRQRLLSGAQKLHSRITRMDSFCPMKVLKASLSIFAHIVQKFSAVSRNEQIFSIACDG